MTKRFLPKPRDSRHLPSTREVRRLRRDDDEHRIGGELEIDTETLLAGRMVDAAAALAGHLARRTVQVDDLIADAIGDDPARNHLLTPIEVMFAKKTQRIYDGLFEDN